MNVLAYFLHANEGYLRPVRLPENSESSKAQFDTIHRLIGCDRVDIFKLWEGHFVFCDKNGLTNGLTCFSELKDHSQPIGGNMVVTGADDEEDIIAPLQAIEAIASLILIARPVLDPDLTLINKPGVFGGNGFVPRFLWQHPIVRAELN